MYEIKTLSVIDGLASDMGGNEHLKGWKDWFKVLKPLKREVMDLRRKTLVSSWKHLMIELKALKEK